VNDRAHVQRLRITRTEQVAQGLGVEIVTGIRGGDVVCACRDVDIGYAALRQGGPDDMRRLRHGIRRWRTR
jgi:hypothetical protein